ncbi:MAG: EamA family transporter [Acidobacteriota bacterium]|nr:EamA family transporter [Acidobacteriota bacterium]
MTSSSQSRTSQGRTSSLRGYLFIAAATFFWGLSATLGKLVFNGGLVTGATPLGPVILAQTRTTFSLLLLFPLLRLIGKRAPAAMTRRDLLFAFAVGIFGIAGSNYFYYLAIQQTSVATAIILQYTAPVWVLLYMVARRLQRATWQRLAGVGMAVAGAALAIGAFQSEGVRLNAIGVIAALLAALTFSFYNVGGRELVARFDRWYVVLYAMAGASLFWLLVNPPWKIWAAHYTASQWLFLFVFACVSMLVPYLLYFAGLHHLDATRAIVVSCLEPVFAISFAWAFVHERVTALQVLGMVIVIAATIIVQLSDASTQKLTPDD